MNNLISYSFIIMIVLIIILSCFSASFPFNYSDVDIDESQIYISEDGFAWPLPGFYSISSYFGPRNSPTAYASSYHYGLDLPASEGTYFLATISGNVSYTGFSGSGGYTIIIQNENVSATYCHVSPNFLVNVRRLCRMC